MIGNINVQCPKCQHPMTLKIPKIIQLQQRVQLLEAILRKNNVQYYDPRLPEQYGRHIDLFVGCEIVSTQDAEYVPVGALEHKIDEEI